MVQRPQSGLMGTKFQALISDFGLESDIVDRINQIVEKMDQPPRLFPLPFALAGSAVIAIAVVLLVITCTSLVTPLLPNPSSLVPVHLETFLATDLTHNRELSTISFDEGALAMAAHPTLPGFVVADKQRRVLLVRPGDGSDLLATTDAPAHWVHVSADGTEAVVCDWSGTVTLIPLNRSAPVTRHRMSSTTNYAYAFGRGVILAVDSATQRAIVLSGSLPLPEDIYNAMPATSSSELIGYEKMVGGNRWASIRDDQGRTLLGRRLEQSQQLRSFDFSEDRSRALLYLSDGTLAFYAKDNGTMVAKKTRALGGDHSAAPFVQIAPAGDVGWVAGRGKLTEWSLDDLEPGPYAAIPLETADALNAYRVQTTRGESILLGNLDIAAVWR